jgi:hypothetical protein
MVEVPNEPNLISYIPHHIKEQKKYTIISLMKQKLTDEKFKQENSEQT